MSESIFPTVSYEYSEQGVEYTYPRAEDGLEGLTKREYFVGMALNGGIEGMLRANLDPEKVANYALSIADAVILKLREEEK